jgi:hypothetical protein
MAKEKGDQEDTKSMAMKKKRMQRDEVDGEEEKANAKKRSQWRGKKANAKRGSQWRRKRRSGTDEVNGEEKKANAKRGAPWRGQEVNVKKKRVQGQGRTVNNVGLR